MRWAARNARHDLGDRAELRVAEWLAAHGWRIVARRVRHAGAELDIVALDPSGVLVAVEVRARRTARAGAPAETLTAAAVARRGAALATYAPQAPPHIGLRLDLVSVIRGPTAWQLTRIPAVEVSLVTRRRRR